MFACVSTETLQQDAQEKPSEVEGEVKHGSIISQLFPIRKRNTYMRPSYEETY